MKEAVFKLEEAIGHTFKDKDLIVSALTLASGSKRAAYERLEFLGDRVLGLVIAEMLYTNFPDEFEGDLAKRHTELVRAETAVKVATDIKLLPALYIAKSEECNIMANPKAYLCDCLEAVIGAIYLDGGFAKARDFVLSKFTSLMKQRKTPPQDSKSALQEWAQGKGLPLPLYKVESISGPEHSPLFVVSVQVEGFAKVISSGISKKKSEQQAAKAFLTEHGIEI